WPASNSTTPDLPPGNLDSDRTRPSTYKTACGVNVICESSQVSPPLPGFGALTVMDAAFLGATSGTAPFARWLPMRARKVGSEKSSRIFELIVLSPLKDDLGTPLQIGV